MVTMRAIRNTGMGDIRGQQELTSVAILKTTFVRVQVSTYHQKERDSK